MGTVFPIDPRDICLPTDGTCFVAEYVGVDIKWFYQNSADTLADVKPHGEDIDGVTVAINEGAVYICDRFTKGKWVCTTKSS